MPRITAPKENLPDNKSSFNPAPEYFDEEIEPKINFRDLETTDELIKDRFERLMSLYMAPRVKRKKI